VSVGKRTSHVLLEGIHWLALCYVENEIGVPIKQVVSL
jgi:hypothetical protein